MHTVLVKAEEDCVRWDHLEGITESYRDWGANNMCSTAKRGYYIRAPNHAIDTAGIISETRNA